MPGAMDAMPGKCLLAHTDGCALFWLFRVVGSALILL